MRFTQCDWIKHQDERTEKHPITSINAVSPHPDGSKIATGGLDTKLKVWATEAILSPEKDAEEAASRLLFTGTAHSGSVMCVRFSSSGQYIASGADDRAVAVWELQPEAQGSRKVWGSTDVNVEVWKPIRMLPGHENDILAVAWAADDRFLASAGVDTMVLVWDGATFEPVYKLAMHTGFVKGLAFDPVGQYLASQGDDRTLKIWDTTDWSLVKDVTDPFVDAPNDSSIWFYKPSWSPDGSFLIAPNAMNGPVFVAGIIERTGFGSSHSLVGHQNIVSSVAYSPLMFLKDPKKPVTDGSNVVALFAMAARSSISIWLSSSPSPIVVLEDVFERDILDLQWSKDSKQLWASSSEGHVGVFSFDLSEFGPDANVAPEGSIERFHAEKWNFKKPPRRVPLANTTNVPSMTQQAILNPQPQKTTIMANGKKRIQPSLISTISVTAAPSATGSFTQTTSTSKAVVFPGVTSAASPNKSRPLSSTAAGGSAVFATASSNPFTNAPIASTSKITMPSRAPSPSQMRLPRFPAMSDDPALFASSSSLRDAMPPNLDTDLAFKPPKHNRAVKGATLGQNRERQKIVIEEIAPAFIPDEDDEEQEMKLAVPAIKTYLKATLKEASETDDDGDLNCLECRNYNDNERPTEVAHLEATSEKADQTMWVDYLEFKVVNATWNGVFGAVSTSEGGLVVYSKAGRRLLPSICLDAPCSFLDVAGPYLLAITARGRMHVWNVPKCQAVAAPSSALDILSAHPSTTIRSAKIRPNGAPIVTLTDGHIYSYHASLQTWTIVSTPWYSKGSDHWEGRTRGRSGSVAGVLKAFEGITNDILVDQSVSWKANDDAMDVDTRVEGEDIPKLGQEEDWSTAMTLAHLESRMAACEALDSPQEFKAALMLYVARLGSEGYRNKAEELVRALMGPIYFKPTGQEAWSPIVCGFQKRDLLKEILAVWSKISALKKMANDSQDLLRRLMDPA